MTPERPTFRCTSTLKADPNTQLFLSLPLSLSLSLYLFLDHYQFKSLSFQHFIMHTTPFLYTNLLCCSLYSSQFLYSCINTHSLSLSLSLSFSLTLSHSLSKCYSMAQITELTLLLSDKALGKDKRHLNSTTSASPSNKPNK